MKILLHGVHKWVHKSQFLTGCCPGFGCFASQGYQEDEKEFSGRDSNFTERESGLEQKFHV